MRSWIVFQFTPKCWKSFIASDSAARSIRAQLTVLAIGCRNPAFHSVYQSIFFQISPNYDGCFVTSLIVEVFACCLASTEIQSINCPYLRRSSVKRLTIKVTPNQRGSFPGTPIGSSTSSIASIEPARPEKWVLCSVRTIVLKQNSPKTFWLWTM